MIFQAYREVFKNSNASLSPLQLSQTMGVSQFAPRTFAAAVVQGSEPAYRTGRLQFILNAAKGSDKKGRCSFSRGRSFSSDKQNDGAQRPPLAAHFPRAVDFAGLQARTLPRTMASCPHHFAELIWLLTMRRTQAILVIVALLATPLALLARGMNGGNSECTTMCCLAPVSYTHLDVYKRQGGR